ncbi:MAG: FAD:protein FMN transferase [Eubacteriales bacterium]|nr:FAD:protein FMN transferase [Eubacteriales bacterium]
MKTRICLILLIFGVVLCGCTACKEPLQAYEKTFFVMDTVVSVQIYTGSASKAELVFDQVLARMEALEGILSAHLPDSDVAKLSRAAGIEAVAVNSATLAVIAESLDFGERTGGAFDITLAPVLRLYNFSPGKEQKPTQDQLGSAMPLVGWQKVELDPEAHKVYLTEKGMQIDLGGVAKGYIIDRCLDVLRENGIDFGLTNAGGDIGLLAEKPDGSPWRVGIKNPENPGTNFAIIEISQGAIATSGDYERFFIEGGKRYHHIIDPRTGMPGDKVRSATILAGSAQLADLLSTAVFVMGPEQGLAFIEELPDVEGVIWDAEGKVHWSSGLVPVQDKASVDYYFRRP